MDTEVFPKGQRDELFGRHVVPHIAALLAAARALTPQLADAEDLVQETLVRAYRGMHRFDGGHPRAWLMTILRNAGADSHRRRRLDLLDHPDQALDDVGEAARSDSAEHVALDAEFDAAVQDAFHTLTRKQRDVVALVDIEGLSYAQAATRLGVPEGTVMSRLHGARARMRHLLAAAGVVPKRGDVK